MPSGLKGGAVYRFPGLVALCVPLVFAAAPLNCRAASQIDPISEARQAERLAHIETLRDQRNWMGALDEIEDGLATNPGSDSLYRLKVLTLSDLGARQLAWELSRAKPALFNDAERARFELDYIARRITWARVYKRSTQDKREQADATMGAIDAYVGSSGVGAMPLRLRYDRLELLSSMERYQEIADEYEALVREGHQVPAYALPPAADALMALKRPEEALPVLARALEAEPDNTSLKVQRAYAWLETERFDLALPALEEIVAAEQPWNRNAGGRGFYQNWPRREAELALHMMRAYAEDLPAAQEGLEALAGMGPRDSGVEASLGSVYQYRGWHEQALERFRIAHTIEPRSVDAQLGQIGALMQLHRLAGARQIRGTLLAEHSDNLHVQTMERDWRNRQGWQWHAFAGADRSNGSSSPLGSRDVSYGVRAEGPLVSDLWRPTFAYEVRSAEFSGETTHDRRLSAGIHYRRNRLDLNASANRASDGLGGTGAHVSAGWRFTDALDGHMQLSRNDPEASLQARHAGISADSAAIGLAYTPHERLSMGAEAHQFRYDDGNRRTGMQASIDRRLISEPHLFVNVIGSVGASRASMTGVPYFNPSRDRSWEVGVRIDHLAKRRYERHFRHQLRMNAGQYWQEGFGSAWVPSAEYRHQWRLAHNQEIAYGISWALPVYDGQRERRVAFNIEYRWGDL